jgi:hypothetical protein
VANIHTGISIREVVFLVLVRRCLERTCLGRVGVELAMVVGCNMPTKRVPPDNGFNGVSRSGMAYLQCEQLVTKVIPRSKASKFFQSRGL